MEDKYLKVTVEEWKKMGEPFFRSLPEEKAKKVLKLIMLSLRMVEIDGVEYMQAVDDITDESMRKLYKKMIESE